MGFISHDDTAHRATKVKVCSTVPSLDYMYPLQRRSDYRHDWCIQYICHAANIFPEHIRPHEYHIALFSI